MSLQIASLNSGSNGNCYYIGNATEAVLIDAGLSCRETEKRMYKLGLPIEKVKAIFISHEHSDHIKGVQGLANKFMMPVFITPGTLKRSGIFIKERNFYPFEAHKPVTIGNLQVTAFPKKHDAADPHSFIIQYKDITVGVFTDIGMACDNVSKYFNLCHAAFLETNYDEHMLENGNYPLHLKKRIRSGEGHLSNKQALEIFIAHRPQFMTHLLLAHLSRENNHPLLVQELFDKHAGNTSVIVASRYEPTALYNIGYETAIPFPNKCIKLTTSNRTMQLNLFE